MSIPNRALADPSAVTPKAASGRSLASSISKEEDRRLKLQQWKEKKAMSEKKTGLSERTAAPDRKAQFFERRERRIRQEQEKKRASRSGKENAPMAMPAADAHLLRKDATAQTTSGTRLVHSPNAGFAPEAQASLTGTTPISALRRPQARVKPLAATTLIPPAGSACAETSDSQTDTPVPVTAAPTAADASAAIRTQTACTTPSRRSALSRPKASPYKERKHPIAPPAAPAHGADEQPGPPPAAPGDRLSGQLARLSADGAGVWREGRAADGGLVRGGAGRRAGAARRETFQDSRGSPTTTGSGVGRMIAGTTLMSRRASSAGPAGGEVTGSGSGSDGRLSEIRRLTSFHGVPPGGQPQEASTPAPSISTPSAMQHMRVSAVSPSAVTVKVRPQSTYPSPDHGVVVAPVEETSCVPAAPASLSSASLPVVETGGAPRVVRSRPAVVSGNDAVGKARTSSQCIHADGEESPVLVTLGQHGIKTEPPMVAPLAPEAAKVGANPVQSTAPTPATPKSPTVQVVESVRDSSEGVGVVAEVSDEVGRVAEPRGSDVLGQEHAKPVLTAAVASAGAGVASKQGTGETVRETSPPPTPPPASARLSAGSQNEKAAHAGERPEVPTRQSTWRAEATEERQIDNARTAEASTAAYAPLPARAMTTGAAAVAGGSSAAAAASAAARGDDAKALSTAAVSDEKMEHASSLLSRVSSLSSRSQGPLSPAKVEGGGTSGGVQTARLEPGSKSSPDEGSPPMRGPRSAEGQPPVAATTEVEVASEVLVDRRSPAASPASGSPPGVGGQAATAATAEVEGVSGGGRRSPVASPSGANYKLGGESQQEGGSRETKGFLSPTRGAAGEHEVIDLTDASPNPGSTSHSGSSPTLSAGRRTPPEGKKATEPTGLDNRKSDGKAGRRLSALTPPGYRSRSRLPAAGRASPPRSQAPAALITAEETKATSSVLGSRPAGLTPPRYRSRSSLLSTAGRKGSPPGQGRIESPSQGGKQAADSCGSCSTRLTPPGSRYGGGSSLLAGRANLARRDRATVATAGGGGGGRSPPKGSDAVQLTPDRRPTRSPQETAGLSSTPPRRGVLSSPRVSAPSPQQQRQQRRQQQRHQRGVVGEAGGSVRKEDAGSSPGAVDDGVSTVDGVAPRVSNPPVADPPRAPEPSLPPVGSSAEGFSPAYQQRGSVGAAGGQEVRKEDITDSPMNRGGCTSPMGAFPVVRDRLAAVDASEARGSRSAGVGVGSPAASPAAAQEQRCPGADASGAVTAGATAGEREGERSALDDDTAFAPPVAAPVCSSPESTALRPPCPPRVVCPAAGDLDAVGGDGCAGLGANAAVAATTRAPPRKSPSSSPVATRTPPRKKAGGKGGGMGTEGKSEPSSELLHRSPNFAAGFVAGRRKRRAVSGVPVVAAASPKGDANVGGGMRKPYRRSEPVAARPRNPGTHGEGALSGEQVPVDVGGESSWEESSGDESGSSWETCSSSDGEGEGRGVAETEEVEGWERLSYLDEMNDHPYGDGIVIDPDLVRSGSSSNGGGSARSSLRRSSFGESYSRDGRRSWAAAAATPDTIKVEMATQTTPEVEGAEHKLVQAGDGRVLSEVEVQEEYNLRELRERLEMMNHDLLAEVFHREVVKQEEAQKRRKLEEACEAELVLREQEMKALRLKHDNEKIKMRWEHADELARVEAEAGDGVEIKHELEEERRLRAEDERRHEEAQRKERQQRKEWEARYDESVKEKRQQGKVHREEIAVLVKKAEAERKKAEARHREAHKKAEGVVQMQLETIKEMDQENDELREENARLRKRLGIENENEEEEEEED